MNIITSFPIYAIKDSLSGQFQDIMTHYSDACAIRYFQNILETSKIAKDLQLFRLGEYNTVNGVITSDVVFLKGGVDNA